MADLNISLLGSFQVSLDGEPVTSFRSNKVRALLAYLCVENNQPHQREKLAGLFWPELAENAARTNLRHSLSNLRAAIGERNKESTSPLLQITPQSIGFYPVPGVEIDTSRFLSRLATETRLNRSQVFSQEQLEAAIREYGGIFLDGFSLPDCASFEEWLILERERFQAHYLGALQELGRIYEQQGQFALAIDCSRRQLALNPYFEQAHRKVMQLLWICGRNGEAAAQYESCRKILKDELGVEPSEPTNTLLRNILAGILPPFDLVRKTIASTVIEPPGFLAEGTPVQPAMFISRDEIFEKLTGLLEKAVAGQMQVAFLVGEAGSGKSTLLNQFLSLAVKQVPDLLAAKGNCSSFTGLGDPYSSFREAINQLAGHVETVWKAGTFSTAQALRNWGAMPLVASCLIEFGADLFGPLVDLSALRARISSASGYAEIPILNYLNPKTPTGSMLFESENQNFLVEQTHNFFLELSKSHPVLLVLDDIQWMDIHSSGLLFHLARTLENSRVLILCAYRPEELEHDHREKPHTITRLLSEFKRRFGDVWIDLNEINLEYGLDFINTFLDAESNKLDLDFREKLFALTSGNPLFTIELVRSLKISGGLQQEESGHWEAKQNLQWDELPARIEGVIEDRVNTMPPALQEILKIASVEGEIFTPFVIAQVSGESCQQILQSISEDLEKTLNIVRYHGEIQLAIGSFPQFRFSHGLFQSYLYSNFNQHYNQEIHHRVGEVLEDLYQDNIETIASRLAVHFYADPIKASHYFQIAGRQAIRNCAFEQGIQYLDQALSISSKDNLVNRYKILLQRARAYIGIGDRQSADQDIAELYSIAEMLEDKIRLTEVILEETRLAVMEKNNNRFLSASIKAEKLAREINHLEYETLASRQIARAYDGLGKISLAEEKFMHSLALARKLNDPWLVAETSRNLSTMYLFSGQVRKAEPYLETALDLFRKHQQPINELKALASLSFYYESLHQYQDAIESLEDMISLSRKMGAKSYEAIAFNNLASLFEIIGMYEEGLECAESGTQVAEEMNLEALITSGRINAACNLLKLNKNEEAKKIFEQSRNETREQNTIRFFGYVSNMLGQISLIEGDPLGAYQYACSVIEELEELPYPPELLTAHGLAALCSLELGESNSALSFIEHILQEGGFDPETPEKIELPILWICYIILAAMDDPRANEILSLGYETLCDRADEFTNPKYRTSYLENVAEHAEILTAYRKYHPESIA
jgi:DNA-binding SARP family transcriptional activator/predicted ATPase